MVNNKLELAPDGKPYHIVNLDKIGKNDVEIIQFLRPDGKRRKMSCDVPPEIKEMSKDMIISSEELTTGQVAIYARFKGEKEYDEMLVLATNGPGPNNPQAKLIEVIKKKWDKFFKEDHELNMRQEQAMSMIR